MRSGFIHRRIILTVLLTLLAVSMLVGCSRSHVAEPYTDLPHILFKTDFGEFEAVLFTKRVPIAANNFLRYVAENRLEDAVFYRVVRTGENDNQPDNDVKIQVLQGGLYREDHPMLLPPIEHETTDKTGVEHFDGTLSMARWHPGTATCEFSICIGDQPELNFAGKRNPDGQGFTAFGQVIRGMDVVRTIHKQPAKEQSLTPFIKINSVELIP